MRRTILLLALLAFQLAGSAAAATAVDGGQWTSTELTFAECMTRTPKALRAEGLSRVEQHGRVWHGRNASGVREAMVFCYGTREATIATIIGHDAERSPEERVLILNLAERIFLGDAAKPSPGTPKVPDNDSGPPTPKPASGGSGWGGTADALAGEIGKTFSWTCPAGGNVVDFVVWGTDVYAIGSRVCIAAVHDGVITAARGGTVTLQIQKDRSPYKGSRRNGVTTLDAGQAKASFILATVLPSKLGDATPKPDPKPPVPPTEPTGGTGWSGTPIPLFGRSETKFTWSCPAGGAARDFVVWGTDVYASGSNVCVAAVHAGVITAAKGGMVTIQLGPSSAAYVGSTRNGVATLSAGVDRGSFTFVR